MRVYLSARYCRQLELLEYSRQLQQAGIQVSSRWPIGQRGPDSLVLYRREDLQRVAESDVADLVLADALVAFTEPPGKPVPGAERGGRHVEFGAALAMGKRCIVVGHRENVFHFLPVVEFFGTWGEAYQALIGGADRPDTEVSGHGDGN